MPAGVGDGQRALERTQTDLQRAKRQCRAKPATLVMQMRSIELADGLLGVHGFSTFWDHA